MHRTSLWLAFTLALLAPSFLVGCDGGNGDPTDPDSNGETPSISISLSSADINITAGASGEVTVTVTRAGGFSGAVTVTPDALTGVTVQPTTIASGATTGTLTFQVGASVAAGALQTTVRANGQGVQEATASLQIQVEPAPDFALSVDPASVTLAQGESQTAEIQIARSGGFAGAVTLTAEGLPTGVTAAFDPTDPTGATSTLTLTASGSADTGGATITVAGTAAELDERTAELALTISEAEGGGSGNAAWAFCDATGTPSWFAYQDGNGPWTRVQPDAQDVFRFQIDSDRGGVAWVLVEDGTPQTHVFYYTRDEIILVGDGQCEGGGVLKTVNGSVAGLGALESAFVSLGGASASVNMGGSPDFVLENVEDGPQDLVAARAEFSATSLSAAPNRIIIRRELNPPDNSTLALLDFATEGFSPASAAATVSGLATGEMTTLSGLYTTAGGGLGTYFSSVFGGGSTTYYGIPSDQMETGDLHYLQVAAVDTSTAGVDSSPDTRQVGVSFQEVQDRTVSLGPPLSNPAVSTVATTPYARIRAQWNLQTEYDRFVFASFNQSNGTQDNRGAIVGATGGFLAGGSTIALEVPDLSAAAGWDDAWGLQTGISTFWTVSGSGWQGTGAINFPELQEGTEYFSATRSGQITP